MLPTMMSLLAFFSDYWSSFPVIRFKCKLCLMSVSYVAGTYVLHRLSYLILTKLFWNKYVKCMQKLPNVLLWDLLVHPYKHFSFLWIGMLINYDPYSLGKKSQELTTIYSCSFWPRGKSLISTNAWICSDLFRNLSFCIYCLERKSCLFMNKTDKFVRNFNQSPQILILRELLNHQGSPLFSERASWLSLQKLGGKVSSSLCDPLVSVNKKATLPCANHSPPPAPSPTWPFWRLSSSRRKVKARWIISQWSESWFLSVVLR